MSYARTGYWVVLFSVAVAVATAHVRDVVRESRLVFRETRLSSGLEPLVDLRNVSGRLLMTNINVPVVGFFADAPAFGVCGIDAVGVAGNLNTKGCQIAFMRRSEYWRTQRPEYFVFFWKP